MMDIPKPINAIFFKCLMGYEKPSSLWKLVIVPDPGIVSPEDARRLAHSITLVSLPRYIVGTDIAIPNSDSSRVETFPRKKKRFAPRYRKDYNIL